MQNDIIISKVNSGEQVVAMVSTLYIVRVNSHVTPGPYIEIEKNPSNND